MSADIINPVLKAITQVISQMARIEIRPGKVRKKQRDEIVEGKNITGLMNITSTQSRASIAITFTESVILEVANNMLPEKKTSIDGLIIDLAGEISNMVMGVAKAELEESGELFDMSLPTVIVGTDYLIAHQTKAPILVMPFDTPEGKFFVEASFDKK
jgi:chemotaxis protein CheX